MIRAEEERQQRVEKLVRMKRILELTKQKKKAEALGIDEEEFEAVMSGAPTTPTAPVDGGVVGGGMADGGAGEGDLADEILSAWKAEGLDDKGMDVDDLQRRIDDLEGSL